MICIPGKVLFRLPFFLSLSLILSCQIWFDSHLWVLLEKEVRPVGGIGSIRRAIEACTWEYR